MKIRIRGASVRLRLSRPEVARIVGEGRIEEATPFAAGTFTYALQKTAEGDALTADFRSGTITMYVPQLLIKDWDTNAVVGMDAHMALPGGGTLHLLLEKDFQCIDQSAEDQSDNYENPNQHC